MCQVDDGAIGDRGVDTVDVVTTDASQYLRESPVDFAGRSVGDAGYAPVYLTFQVGERHLAFELGRGQGLEGSPRTVRQHYGHLLDLVDGFAVNDGVRSARVVAHRTADVGARRSAWIRGEVFARMRDSSIEFVDGDTGLGVHPTLFAVDLDNVVHEFREVDDDASIYGLA